MNTEAITAITTAIVAVVTGLLARKPVAGFGAWGQRRAITATVRKTWVDVQWGFSHYLVATDQGVFEIANNHRLYVRDADEMFGLIEAGKTYIFDLCGNTTTNALANYYPLIVTFDPATTAPAQG